MLLGIDLLARLRDKAETAQSLAGVLRTDEAETRRVLDLLLREGLVSFASGGYDPSTQVGIYSISPQGEELYGLVLDRFGLHHTGPPSMSVGECFLTALAEPAPIATRMRLFELLDRTPEERDDLDRRADAVVIGRAAVECAQLALDVDEGTRGGAALGLRSLARNSAEQLGYAGKQLRDDYLSDVVDPELREVAEHAAAACEAAWELRPLGPRIPETNISLPNTPHPDSYYEVADEAAAALAALAGHSRFDVVAEADKVIQALRPR